MKIQKNKCIIDIVAIIVDSIYKIWEKKRLRDYFWKILKKVLIIY